jgi:hypothetical protein
VRHVCVTGQIVRAVFRKEVQPFAISIFLPTFAITYNLQKSFLRVLGCLGARLRLKRRIVFKTMRLLLF